jgi:outer membrane protein TolC
MVLDSYKRQLVLGQAKELDVLTQESQLAQNEATLPPLAKQLAQQRDLLTALAGRFPLDVSLPGKERTHRRSKPSSFTRRSVVEIAAPRA